MRYLMGIFLLAVTLVPSLSAQKNKNGVELDFSLVHPVKMSLNEYKYSADPTLEVLYFTSISKKLWVAGGLFVQSGKHNWLETTGHTFVDDFGMPYRLRTDYSRQLEFFSLGIPLRVGMDCNCFVFNSLFLGFTAGNHLKLTKADYYNSEFVANVETNYNELFWELNLGFRKILIRSGTFELSLSSSAGFRKNIPSMQFGYDNYFFYAAGVSSKFGK